MGGKRKLNYFRSRLNSLKPKRLKSAWWKSEAHEAMERLLKHFYEHVCSCSTCSSKERDEVQRLHDQLARLWTSTEVCCAVSTDSTNILIASNQTRNEKKSHFHLQLKLRVTDGDQRNIRRIKLVLCGMFDDVDTDWRRDTKDLCSVDVEKECLFTGIPEWLTFDLGYTPTDIIERGGEGEHTIKLSDTPISTDEIRRTALFIGVGETPITPVLSFPTGTLQRKVKKTLDCLSLIVKWWYRPMVDIGYAIRASIGQWSSLMIDVVLYDLVKSRHVNMNTTDTSTLKSIEHSIMEFISQVKDEISCDTDAEELLMLPDSCNSILEHCVQGYQDTLPCAAHVLVEKVSNRMKSLVEVHNCVYRVLRNGYGSTKLVQLLWNEHPLKPAKIITFFNEAQEPTGNHNFHAEMRLWEHFAQQRQDTSNVYIGLNKSCCMMCNAALCCTGTRIDTFGDHPNMYPWKLPPLLEAEDRLLEAFLGDEAYRAFSKLRYMNHLKEHEQQQLRQFAVELVEKVADIHKCRKSKEELQIQEPYFRMGLNS